jgi:drug/metabolite transporter (DMT)-like permease
MAFERSVAHHILPTAATMAGVCLTVISIIKLTELSYQVSTLIDDFLAGDGAIFLISAFLSYLSLRDERLEKRLEHTADVLFLVGMAIMVICAFLLVYAMGYV